MKTNKSQNKVLQRKNDLQNLKESISMSLSEIANLKQKQISIQKKRIELDVEIQKERTNEEERQLHNLKNQLITLRMNKYKKLFDETIEIKNLKGISYDIDFDNRREIFVINRNAFQFENDRISVEIPIVEKTFVITTTHTINLEVDKVEIDINETH